MIPQSFSERNADVETIVNSAIARVMSSVHVSSPGIVKSFDATTQTATVQTVIRQRIRTEKGIEQMEQPILTDVPVLMLGGGNHALTFPVAEGDECLVIFADTCIDAWFQSGGVQNAVVARKHDMSDAFAIVGFRSKPNSLSGVGVYTEPHIDSLVVGMHDVEQTLIEQQEDIDELDIRVGEVEDDIEREIEERQEADSNIEKQLNVNPNLLVSDDMSKFTPVWEYPYEWLEYAHTEYVIPWQLYKGYVYVLTYDAIQRVYGSQEKIYVANWQADGLNSVEARLPLTDTPSAFYFWLGDGDTSNQISLFSGAGGEIYGSQIRVKNLKLYCLNSGADIVYPCKATGFFQNIPANFNAGYTTIYEFKKNGTYTFSIGKVKNASVLDSSSWGCQVSVWDMRGVWVNGYSFAISNERQSFTFTLDNADTQDLRLFLYAGERAGRFTVQLEHLKLEKGNIATVWTDETQSKFATLNAAVEDLSGIVNSNAIGNLALSDKVGSVQSDIAKLQSDFSQSEMEHAGANPNIFPVSYLQETGFWAFMNPADLRNNFNVNGLPIEGGQYKNLSKSNVPLPAYTAGTWFTYSFWACSDYDGAYMQTYVMLDGTTPVPAINSQGATDSTIYGVVNFRISTQWKKYWVKVQLNAVKQNVYYFVMSRINEWQGYHNIYIAGCKFEKNDYATEWSDLPQLPSDASTKTYTLQAVNGVLKWV